MHCSCIVPKNNMCPFFPTAKPRTNRRLPYENVLRILELMNSKDRDNKFGNTTNVLISLFNYIEFCNIEFMTLDPLFGEYIREVIPSY